METILEVLWVMFALTFDILLLGCVLWAIKEGFETYIKHIVDNRSK